MEILDFRPTEQSVISLVQIVEKVPQDFAPQDPVVIDRYSLSLTWYNLIRKLGGRHPSVLDQAMMNMAYNKIADHIMQMTDKEIMEDMDDIIKSVEYIKLRVIPTKKGVFRK